MSKKADLGAIRVTRHSAAYWRVTIEIPPLNIFGPANIPQMEQAVQSIEEDNEVKAVVFDSSVDGFFATHYDFLSAGGVHEIPSGAPGAATPAGICWRGSGGRR